MNEPKVYQHKAYQFIILIILFGLIFVSLFLDMKADEAYFQIIFVTILGLVFLTSLYSMTVKTIISDNEISTRTILGTKSLAWNEINRISGTGYKIKLHSLAGDTTIVPSSQLPGYDEVIEQIGSKRPDLFNPLEYSEMKRSWLILFPMVLFVVLFVAGLLGAGLLIFNNSETRGSIFMPLAFVIVIGLVFLGVVLSSPQAVRLDGKSMNLKYLFSEKSLLANEIKSVELRFTQTRNGKNYFVLLSKKDGKSLRISGLNVGLPIVYLVLKNWHKKYTGIGLTTQNNFFN